MASASLPAQHVNPKLARILVTPEGVAMDVSVATAGARLGALLIDIGIIFGLLLGFFLLFLLIGWAYSMSGLPALNDGFAAFMIVTVIIVLFLARNAYFLFFELGPRSATWGKRSVGIRVAARDGGRLSAEAIIARNLVREIELFLPLMFMVSTGVQGGLTTFAGWAGTIWVGIFMLFPLFNRDRLRCGDLIAGTWVVNSQKVSLGAVVATGETAREDGKALSEHGGRYQFSEEELSVYGEYELQTLEKVLRADNVEAQETVCAAICGKIGWNPGAGDERAFLEAYYTQLRARLERNMRFGRRRADKHSES